ncbi:wax synthase family protein [Mucilaginibacter myungsuensis]|uniref:Membrane bound O-acyl transferase family-domain-containing protein n=1 Tax=Mucilaginibacter myungsuensis TaxID=649104 RepID=A0A929KUV5_9SPHI|nr:membrane bound O-acyl transferase family-domain-containing protein [Mucilaginibacter myungsuensis]MBE9660880.1 membrane bound O-acyl transferase family-domain-containing protein [Mucilaginibacter myungsuensis]MDN3600927.1 membrane bound O-acyl transferase family-domain-containing protein [Mucilaginibacter myungsuensis]
MSTELIVSLLYFMLINISVTLLGYVLIKKQQVALSWLLLIVSIAGIYLVMKDQHPIIKMLGIIAITFTAMKVIAVTEGYKGKPLTLNFKQWLVFAGGWAGMRAQPFETLGSPALPGAWKMIGYGISRVFSGAMLIALAHIIRSQWAPVGFVYALISVLLLIGFSLILHFGLLSISAGTYRLQGVNTYLLFRQPAMATSLTEFWSKRWNIAFSEMTSVAIFRPLKNKFGSAGALILAFAFSGLLHELALSVPVSAGYGLPMLYFLLHGGLVLTEKALTVRKIKLLQHPVVARVWIFFWLAVPMPLLFHPAFIKGILWPLAGLAPF